MAGTSRGRRELRACVRLLLWMAPLLCSTLPAQGQLVPLGDDGIQTQPAQALPSATVHGVVRNAITGSPLPRALVHLRGSFDAGALTDGDGRFEIPAVPLGVEELSVIKPGFFDTDAPPVGGFAGPQGREAESRRICRIWPSLCRR